MAHLMSSGWSDAKKRPSSMAISSTDGSASGSQKPKPSKMMHTLGRVENLVRKDVAKRPAVDGKRYDARYKIVMLGDSGVGKTSLIRSTMGETFTPIMMSTIGIDFVEQIYLFENYRIQLQIWDTAGQERYRSLANSSFRDAKAYVIVYDITSKSSFAKIQQEWLRLTDMYNSSEPVPIFIVGNKLDVVRLREVPKIDAEKFSQQQCAHGFFETSARTGLNVQSLFQAVAKTMVCTWGLPKIPVVNNEIILKLDDQTSIPKKVPEKVIFSKFNCCS